jgi:hypothetical protein
VAWGTSRASRASGSIRSSSSASSRSAVTSSSGTALSRKGAIGRRRGLANEPATHRGSHVVGRRDRRGIEVAKVLEIDVAALEQDDRQGALRVSCGEVAADRRAPGEADERGGVDRELVEEADEQRDHARGDVRLGLGLRRAAVAGDVGSDDSPGVGEDGSQARRLGAVVARAVDEQGARCARLAPLAHEDRLPADLHD